VKFYLDEDLAPAIASTLRQRGVDAISAHDVGHLELEDKAPLAFAAREGRCLVTGNARDFRVLGQDAVARRPPHAGIVLGPPKIPRFGLGAVVNALVKNRGAISGRPRRLRRAVSVAIHRSWASPRTIRTPGEQRRLAPVTPTLHEPHDRQGRHRPAREGPRARTRRVSPRPGSTR
jgi:Domain of unknown function (DUF5615)